jgi:hypothetical protein
VSDRRTLWDLVATDALDGRRVRFKADDVPELVPLGSIGTVMSTCSNAALVEYLFPERGERNPWRRVLLESKFSRLELVEVP